MSETGIDAATLAKSLRRMAGDGSVEWVMEPIQTSVLLNIADMLDENAELRKERDLYEDLVGLMVHPEIPDILYAENNKLRELVRDMWGWLTARTVSGAALHDISGRMHKLGVEVD